MITSSVKPFHIGIFAAITAAIVAYIAFQAPATVFGSPDFFNKGIRLVRDDYELDVYRARSDWVAEGGAPYTEEYRQEYPPLGVLYLALPRFVTDDPRTYRKAFVAMNVALFGALVGITAMLLDRLGRPRRLLALFFLPAFLYFSLWRYDLLPAALSAAAFLAVFAGSIGASFVLLTLATLAKWYPAFFFIPLFMFLGGRRISRRGIRSMRAGIIGMVLVLSATVVIVTAVAGFGALSEPVFSHLSRNFEVGSLGGALLVLFFPGTSFSPGEWRLYTLPFLLLQFAATVPLLLFARVGSFRAFVRACLFTLIPFMIFGRFFSQQWLLWLTPAALLVAGRREIILLALLDITVFTQFPILFGIDPRSWHYEAVTLVRSALLMALWYANSRALFTPQRQPIDSRTVL